MYACTDPVAEGPVTPSPHAARRLATASVAAALQALVTALHLLHMIASSSSCVVLSKDRGERPIRHLGEGARKQGAYHGDPDGIRSF
jgi:hypothetical protein